MTDNPTASIPGANAEEEDGSVPLPSYEERYKQEKSWSLNDKTRLSADAVRIRWTLDGPLETSLSIVELGRIYDPDEVPEPYFLGNDQEGNPTWHPFSQSPFTSRPVSSLSISVKALNEAADNWWGLHFRHFEDEIDDSDEAHYGVSECCGDPRPIIEVADLTVKGTGTPGGFVTVHDFFSAVHPYLMSRRDDILKGMGGDVLRQDKPPLPSNTKLVGSFLNPDYINIKTEAEWQLLFAVRTPAPLQQ